MLLFIVFGAVAIAAGLGVIASRRPVYSALFLLLHFAALAALYIMLQAQFLAAVQVIVYAGAIVVLFLFVVMLVGGGEIRDGALGSAQSGAEGAQRSATRGQETGLRRTATGSPVAPWPGASPRWTRIAAVALLALMVVGLCYAVITGVLNGAQGNAAAFGQGSVQALGQALYTTYLLPFELTSVLLLVGIIGAVVLARKEE